MTKKYTKVNPENGLNVRQEAFCHAFINTKGNRAEAYRQAEYKGVGSTAYVNASNLLKNPKVRTYIYKLREEAAELAIAPLAETLEHLSYLARSDISEYKNCTTLNHFQALPKELRVAVESFTPEITTDDTFTPAKIKLHSKTQAIALLFKYYGAGEGADQIRMALKPYGIAMIPDDSSPMGYRFEPTD